MVLLSLMSVSKIFARSISGNIQSIIILSPYDTHQESELMPIEQTDDDNNNEHLKRNKREAYDPYAQYYYYPSSLNRPERTRLQLDRRDSDGQTALLQNGNKYKYTPLFQYKSTQAKRRKLFVPNLFG